MHTTVPRNRDGFFKPMKISSKIIPLFAAITTLILSGCATPVNDEGVEKEYSDMPWNTPAQWEGSRSIPGMGQGGY
jgi:hypothetical protein